MVTATESLQFTRVSTASQASYSFDTQTVNQYNKKRVIQTKINYDPISVSFYDTHDNHWHNIWEQYMAYYYNGGRGLGHTTDTGSNQTTSKSFATDQGFTPNSDRYFFKTISVIQHGREESPGIAATYRETRLINPAIISMSGDTLDYSDSQPVQYAVTFQPESVTVSNENGQYAIDTTSAP